MIYALYIKEVHPAATQARKYKSKGIWYVRLTDILENRGILLLEDDVEIPASPKRTYRRLHAMTLPTDNFDFHTTIGAKRICTRNSGKSSKVVSCFMQSLP